MCFPMVLEKYRSRLIRFHDLLPHCASILLPQDVTVMQKYFCHSNMSTTTDIIKESIINHLATYKAFRNTQKSEWHRHIIFKLTNHL